MKRSSFTEGQIICAVKQLELGVPLVELARKYSASQLPLTNATIGKPSLVTLADLLRLALPLHQVLVNNTLVMQVVGDDGVDIWQFERRVTAGDFFALAPSRKA